MLDLGAWRRGTYDVSFREGTCWIHLSIVIFVNRWNGKSWNSWRGNLYTWNHPKIQWVIAEDLYGCFHSRDGRDGSWIFFGYFLCFTLWDLLKQESFTQEKNTHTICWCLVVTSTILLFHSFQDPLGKVAGSHTKKSRKRRKTQIKDSLLTPEESWNQKNKMKIQWHRGTAYSNKVKLTETSFTNSVFDTLFSLFLYVII